MTDVFVVHCKSYTTRHNLKTAWLVQDNIMTDEKQ